MLGEGVHTPAQLERAHAARHSVRKDARLLDARGGRCVKVPKPPSQPDLLVILRVVLVAPRVLVLLPVLSVLAGGEQHHVLRVMDVV